MATSSKPFSAYRREASRLDDDAIQRGAKIVNRDAELFLGPFSIHYSATDYTLEVPEAVPERSFADSLDAAATVEELPGMLPIEVKIPAVETTTPVGVRRRLAFDGYRAATDPAEPVVDGSSPAFSSKT